MNKENWSFYHHVLYSCTSSSTSSSGGVLKTSWVILSKVITKLLSIESLWLTLLGLKRRHINTHRWLILVVLALEWLKHDVYLDSCERYNRLDMCITLGTLSSHWTNSAIKSPCVSAISETRTVAVSAELGIIMSNYQRAKNFLPLCINDINNEKFLISVISIYELFIPEFPN